jgi:cytochrome c biogenesis protein CcmG, thiol:disulfide interchange protein DsbE
MNWRRAIIGAAIAFPMVALLGYGMTKDPRKLPNTLPGQVAPDFTLSVMDAETDSIRLWQLRGQVVVLNFWASWCLECQTEHRLLSDISDEYKPRGVRFYGVLFRDTPENAREWIKQMGGQSYSNLLDPKTAMAIDYGLTGVPETVIIDRNGQVAHKQIGPYSPQTADQLRTKLDSLLAIPANQP